MIKKTTILLILLSLLSMISCKNQDNEAADSNLDIESESIEYTSFLNEERPERIESLVRFLSIYEFDNSNSNEIMSYALVRDQSYNKSVEESKFGESILSTEVRVGEEIVVLLPQYMNNAYSWYIVNFDEFSSFEVANMKIPSEVDGREFNGGIDKSSFFIRINGIGEHSLEFRYQHIDEENKSIELEKTLKINIKCVNT